MGVHASLSRLRRELAAAAPMPTPEKKRPVADFFRSYKKPPTFSTTSNVPQKRPSPAPEGEAGRTVLRETQPSAPRTPIKDRKVKANATPKRPVFSPVTPRSGRLPFRSPGPTSAAQSSPSSVRKALRLIEEQNLRELRAEKPSPQRQTTIELKEAPKPTQSVFKEGKVVAVKDSDEDDSDSLASIDGLFGFKKRDGDDTELSSPPDVQEEAREADRVKTLNLFTQSRPHQRPGFLRIRELNAQEKAHKFDLSKLLNDHYDAQEDEESVQKSRDRYEVSKARLEPEKKAELHEDLLHSLITSNGGDEDELSRLMSAVSRTEALSTEKAFSFFGASGMTNWDSEDSPESDFPENAIPFGLWRGADEDACSRCYLSGFMTELAGRAKLSDSALSWTFDAVMTESDDALRGAYAECLKRGSPTWTRTNLTAEDVHRCFQTLGAEEDNVRTGETIQSKNHPIRKQTTMLNSKYLLTMLDVFQELCLHMDFLALSKLASLVCRLALDTHMMSYGNISSAVESLLSTLLDLPSKETRLYIADQIFSDLSQTLHDPVLQATLLSHLLPTSPTSTELRIRLAHAFLLDRSTIPSSLTHPFTPSLARLSKHITTSPHFNTTHPSRVDYTSLRARAHILDIAVSDGSSPTPSLSTSSTSQFNKSVDAVASTIKRTFITIADTGASHMKRTEAKDVLQALYWRLLFAVRTEPRPKKNIFDGESGRLREGGEYREEGRGKDFMKGFLAKGKRMKMEREEGTGLKREETIDLPSQRSERSESEILIRRQLGVSQ